jgi:hypothetical protein
VSGKYITNKIRCKKCKHFKKTEDKNVGICSLRSYPGVIFVRPNQQIENCFTKGDEQE